MPETETSSNAGRIAFTYPDFTLYQLARFLIVAGLEMQSVAVGWQIYEISHRPLDLGLVGLAQFSPGILLFLATGHAADTFNRRKLLMACYAGFGVCSALLLLYALSGLRAVLPMYGVVVLLGVVRSFNNPASRSLLPQIIPEEHLQNAIAWNSSVNQGGTILGPSLGGLIYAVANGPAAVYATSMLAAGAAAFLMAQVKLRARPRPKEPVSLKSVLAGLHYIMEKKIILGSISLDLFAVLLGGAIALLPVFAAEVLRTGPWGLGLLRASPAIGAGSMALLLAHRPFRSRAGVTMLWCVGGFGAFTVLFGISRSLVLSMIALMLVGSMDMVSVVVRSTLVQLATPDEMRGRVSAVEMIFIGASNEIGQFESGLTAQWFGAVPAVILGGVGTLLITALWAWNFPELRRVEKLSSLRP
ncbi:MAG TPA: MFS transporter [Candidatus Acidoferrales bacterium]|jgi:MFS family permease|nr:MFS transporter [Candidatus Acidoferrales bacterium]